MLCSNLMMVSHLDEDEVSHTQGVRKSKTFYIKGTTPSSKVTKLCKKQCQILRSLRLKKNNSQKNKIRIKWKSKKSYVKTEIFSEKELPDIDFTDEVILLMWRRIDPFVRNTFSIAGDIKTIAKNFFVNT